MNIIGKCVVLSLLFTPSLAAAVNTPDTMEYVTSPGWWANNSAGLTGDWAPYEFKGECTRSLFVGQGQETFWHGGIHGLSGNFYRRMTIHGLECTDYATGAFGYESFHPYPIGPTGFDSTNLPITTQHPEGYDWDPNYQKATCYTNKFVAGVAQQTNDTMIDKVMCANVKNDFTRNDNTCYPITMGVDYDGTNHQFTGSPEWDTGFQKGYCGSGNYVAGISRNVPEWDPNFGGGIHAILCCGTSANAHTP